VNLLPCTLNGQYVTVTIVPRSSSILEKTKIEIKISKILNPGSTKMTSEFQIQIRENLGFIMAQSITGNGAKFRVNAPNSI
jgi:hypothetical protein